MVLSRVNHGTLPICPAMHVRDILASSMVGTIAEGECLVVVGTASTTWRSVVENRMCTK